ncbi:hypothetical protein CXB51_019096 [Gossypium anomalum]|uniref:DRBM domain-containing protein n=1 Tax=Gossypium anomalum TaxID=47600 RepID=A0A8J5YNK1_9ROSI|nr:hypothetical protein CXB51_019096 [Gossypium anomalum]
MYKNQLQELAQITTIKFNGETFETPTFCSTLRQAEHILAEVALNTLVNKGPSKALATRILLEFAAIDYSFWGRNKATLEFISTAQDEANVYKNLLQETTHRAGLNLPVYTTIRSGPGHVPTFSCMVEPYFFHKTENSKVDINSSSCPTKNKNRSSIIFHHTQIQKNKPWLYVFHFHEKGKQLFAKDLDKIQTWAILTSKYRIRN